MTDLSAGNAKLIQYLNEAYGTERRLEVALQAHIGLATRATYKNRLRDHLTETKRHAREVSKRIKQLGGAAEAVDIPGPDALGGVAQLAVAGAQRAAALAQGPLHALRGTGEQEKQLKNAKSEYASEAEEIATYTAIISAAEAVGDQDTVKLARAILREEQRMSSYLEREIPRMASAVVVAEVPRSERAANGGRRRRRKASRSSARGTQSRASRGRSRASSGRSRTTSSGRSRSASAGRSRSASASGRSRSASASGRSRSASSRGATSGRSRSASASSRSRSASAGRSRSASSSRSSSRAPSSKRTGTSSAPRSGAKRPPIVPGAPVGAAIRPSDGASESSERLGERAATPAGAAQLTGA